MGPNLETFMKTYTTQAVWGGKTRIMNTYGDDSKNITVRLFVKPNSNELSLVPFNNDYHPFTVENDRSAATLNLPKIVTFLVLSNYVR